MRTLLRRAPAGPAAHTESGAGEQRVHRGEVNAKTKDALKMKTVYC